MDMLLEGDHGVELKESQTFIMSHPGSGPHHIPSSNRRSTILFALGLDHALTNYLVGHPSGIALARTRLTSEFRWNLKPVSS
ncbi:hypothetical protein DVH24_012850 [Malus domestica]|uniref:Uncharacterized protein n=1 Tax=Malus domestica TaxID=3750 RepID=A0A498HNY5_MALDO|nr:hypothetical protein DVH24_012850 [Malus domestica]